MTLLLWGLGISAGVCVVAAFLLIVTPALWH